MQKTLTPLLNFCAELDLRDEVAAQQALEAAYPFGGDFVRSLGVRMKREAEAGTLCDRGQPPVQWSRVFSASEETCGFSADAVLMSSPGPRHRHPEGEIDLCFAIDGDPLFDDHSPGWVVYGPDSVHVPTVAGGTMLILYLLPSGAIEFLEA